MYNRSLAAMLAGQQRRPRSPMDPHGQIFGVPPPGQPGGHGGNQCSRCFGWSSAIGGTPVPPPGQNPPPGSMADTSIANTIFTNDFINSVASSLEDFGPELFRQDADISFERDFGQWFNPDDSMGLDMKGSTLPAQQPPPLVELPQHPFQQPPLLECRQRRYRICTLKR
ncbi:hypothetical protein BDQ17DRAFT_836862 [Cyathus striatus]|nr:hypothetical protein BDQ17DRAFT_836862 [Cyathus striatus]